MIKHLWTLVCRESKLDALTNNISIIDSLESMQFSLNTEDPNYKKGSAISAPFNFEVVSLFFRDSLNEDSLIYETIIVLDPKGQKLGEFKAKVQFEEGKNRMRSILKSNMIALTVSGTYVFQIFSSLKDSGANKEMIVALPVDISVTVNGEQI